jgi:hypothetical protein
MDHGTLVILDEGRGAQAPVDCSAMVLPERRQRLQLLAAVSLWRLRCGASQQQ